MNTHKCSWSYNGGPTRTLKGTYEEITNLVHFMRHVSPLQRDNITGPTLIEPKANRKENEHDKA